MIQIDETQHVPERYAADTGSEFDPTTETHHFGFVVKIVDPGCTLEFQIEERNGRVTRLTSTDDAIADYHALKKAVISSLDRMWSTFKL